MNQTKSPHNPKQGFSLIELLVVMAIIATLMGLVIGVSGAIQRKTAIARARAELADLMNEIEIYKSDNGSYPLNWDEFGSWYFTEKYSGTAYTTTDFSSTTDLLSGNPFEPLDPWGGEIRYQKNSEFLYLIGSKGPDTSNGGNGSNSFGDGDDITNRNGSL